MESTKPKTILRKKEAPPVKDDLQDGEGRLFITVDKNTSIKIGDTRMHVVKANYGPKGVSQFRIMFVGPKNVRINRIPREKNEQ